MEVAAAAWVILSVLSATWVAYDVITGQPAIINIMKLARVLITSTWASSASARSSPIPWYLVESGRKHGMASKKAMGAGGHEMPESSPA